MGRVSTIGEGVGGGVGDAVGSRIGVGDGAMVGPPAAGVGDVGALARAVLLAARFSTVISDGPLGTTAVAGVGLGVPTATVPAVGLGVPAPTVGCTGDRVAVAVAVAPAGVAVRSTLGVTADADGPALGVRNAHHRVPGGRREAGAASRARWARGGARRRASAGAARPGGPARSGRGVQAW